MLYPVYIYPGNEDTAYGVEFPDFYGCNSAADELEDLPVKIQEAVEVYYEGEDLDIPAPSKMEALVKDKSYKGGFWMMANIDLSRLSSETRRINITIPQVVLTQIDKTTNNRSQFLAEAAIERMARLTG